MTWILIAGIALLVVYELLAAFAHRGPTISRLIWDWNTRWPVIPFAFGLLMGHLFL